MGRPIDGVGEPEIGLHHPVGLADHELPVLDGGPLETVEGTPFGHGGVEVGHHDAEVVEVLQGHQPLKSIKL